MSMSVDVALTNHLLIDCPQRVLAVRAKGPSRPPPSQPLLDPDVDESEAGVFIRR